MAWYLVGLLAFAGVAVLVPTVYGVTAEAGWFGTWTTYDRMEPSIEEKKADGGGMIAGWVSLSVAFLMAWLATRRAGIELRGRSLLIALVLAPFLSFAGEIALLFPQSFWILFTGSWEAWALGGLILGLPSLLGGFRRLGDRLPVWPSVGLPCLALAVGLFTVAFYVHPELPQGFVVASAFAACSVPTFTGTMLAARVLGHPWTDRSGFYTGVLLVGAGVIFAAAAGGGLLAWVLDFPGPPSLFDFGLGSF